MTNRFLQFFAFFFALLAFGFAAQAQECGINYEMIFQMKEPKVGAYNIWDSILGNQEREEELFAGLALKNTNILVTGERRKHKNAAPRMLLVEIGKRGRGVWEREYYVENLGAVKALAPHPDGFAVLATQEKSRSEKQVWLGFFNADGMLLDTVIIKSDTFALEAESIALARDGKGYVVMATAREKFGSAYHAMFYKVDMKGKILSDRAYLPGPGNKITDIKPYGEDKYVATGLIFDETDRQIAWLLLLEDDGGIVWQRQYARGRAAEFHAAAEYGSNYIVVAGESEPYMARGRGLNAGWVMLVSKTNGDIIWQRYYAGDLSYGARDLLVDDDGMISVLLNGERREGDETAEYVRLLSINPRGILLISDEYFNAEGTQGYDLLFGPVKERIIVGSSDMVYTMEGKEGQAEPDLIRSKDGWVIAATPMEPYTDPCQ